jgi:parallel beta-helix repeat protein
MCKHVVIVGAFLGVLMVCLVSSGFVVANFTPLPTLPPPVCICADGSVDPVSAPIQRDGNTYTLIGDVNNTIEIQRSNVVLDGDGFKVTKPDVDTSGLMMPIGWLPGVNINGTNNITVTNLGFEGFITGVRVENASEITLCKNTIRGTSTGIAVFSSSNVNIINNSIWGFDTGIHFLPSDPNASISDHIKVQGNQIVGSATEVPDAQIQPNQYGVWGGFTQSQLIANNFSSIEGIALYYSGINSIIAGNNFERNYRGISFYSQIASNNTFYGNSFVHNGENAKIAFIRNSPVNFWDNGTVGNYWSNYTGTDINGDGLGDTPYLLETTYYDYLEEKSITLLQGQDNYPVMKTLPLSNGTFKLTNDPETIPTAEPPSPTPSVSPQIPELSLTIALTATVAAGLLAAVIWKRGRRY